MRGRRGKQTHSRSSGADLSATQARVRSWRSRLSRGTASKVGSTSRRMSSISMGAGGEAGRAQERLACASAFPVAVLTMPEYTS